MRRENLLELRANLEAQQEADRHWSNSILPVIWFMAILALVLLIGYTVARGFLNETVEYKSWTRQECVKVIQYVWGEPHERSCGWEGTPVGEVVWIK